MSQQNKGTMLNRYAIVGIVIAVLVVIGLVVTMVVRGGGEDEVASEGSAPTKSEQPKDNSNSGNDDGVEEDIPGAFPGNTQRHWPRENPDLPDDSGWGTPASYVTDVFARPLWIPENHDGDLAKASDKKDAPGQCENVQLEGKTQQQYVNGRFMAVNETAGPFAFDYSGSFPEEYAHSPQGAVIAAINARSYGWLNLDEIGVAANYRLWDWKEADEYSQKEVQYLRDIYTYEAAQAFDIVTCTDDLVVVDLQVAPDADRPGNGIMRLPMKWDGETWVATLTPEDEKNAWRDVPEDIDFTQIEYK